MADQLQLRGGTTAENDAFTGVSREVTIDTEKNTVVVHDGFTEGGHPLLREADTATLLARANHTGTQTMSTISDAGTAATQDITENATDTTAGRLLKVGDNVERVVDTISDLLGTSEQTVKSVRVLNYHTGLEGGGGVFYWDATKVKSEHNGGTVIDPTAVFPTDWNNQTQLGTWFDTSNAGTGCWVRQYDGEVNVKWFGAKGDNVSNDTLVIQAAIDLNLNLYFPPSNYAVTTVNFNRMGRAYTGTLSFRGIASTPTTAVVEITQRTLRFDYLAVNQSWNTNYTCAVRWHSLNSGNPAQYINIEYFAVTNCIIGLLFGGIGENFIDAPQSENTINYFRSRGCQTPIYFNLPNGFLQINGGVVNSLRNEWESQNPGVYSYADAKTIEIHRGVLTITSAELLKTDTQLGVGILQTGGGLLVSNSAFEINCKVLLQEGGDLMLNNITAYNTSTLGFLEVAQTSTGRSVLNNIKWSKNPAATNSQNGFINHNGAKQHRFTLNNILVSQQLFRSFCRNESFGTNAIDSFPFLCNVSNVFVQDEDANRPDLDISSLDTKGRILATKGVDVNLDSLDGWYTNRVAGAGTTIGIVADAPPQYGKYPKLTNCLAIDTTGTSSIASTIDTTSYETAKQTGFKVKGGQVVVASGWCRQHRVGSQRQIVLVCVDANNVRTQVVVISTARMQDDWQYFSTPVQIPSGVEYIGIGIDATTSEVRLTGVSLDLLR